MLGSAEDVYKTLKSELYCLASSASLSIYPSSRFPTSVNTEQFRQSLKLKWLKYYRDNREWLTQLGVWISYEGQRRPSSSFILATVSVLEPRLCQLMPIVVGLSSNPDRVVKAMGLNFSPDEELEKAIADGLLSDSSESEEMRLLPPGRMVMNPAVDVKHSVEGTTPAMTEKPKDAVDLYLDQDRQEIKQKSAYQIAADQDAACYGVGGREPLTVSARERSPQVTPSRQSTEFEVQFESHEPSLDAHSLQADNGSQAKSQVESHVESSSDPVEQSVEHSSEAITASFGQHFPDTSSEAQVDFVQSDYESEADKAYSL